jgi:hypothetical protein
VESASEDRRGYFEDKSNIRGVMKPKEITEDSLTYMKAALALSGIVADIPTCEIIAMTFDKLKELGAEFRLNDAAKIKAHVIEKYKNKEA